MHLFIKLDRSLYCLGIYEFVLPGSKDELTIIEWGREGLRWIGRVGQGELTRRYLRHTHCTKVGGEGSLNMTLYC